MQLRKETLYRRLCRAINRISYVDHSPNHCKLQIEGSEILRSTQESTISILNGTSLRKRRGGIQARKSSGNVTEWIRRLSIKTQTLTRNRAMWKDLVRWSAAKRHDDGTWLWNDDDDDDDDIRYRKHFKVIIFFIGIGADLLWIQCLISAWTFLSTHRCFIKWGKVTSACVEE